MQAAIMQLFYNIYHRHNYYYAMIKTSDGLLLVWVCTSRDLIS